MKVTIGYWIGFVACLLIHSFLYEDAKECKQVDSVMMCRTVHYGDWKEVK